MKIIDSKIMIVLILIFLAGCQNQELKKENLRTGMPPLLIFGQADVIIKVLNINKDLNSININSKVENIENYVTQESKDILLNKDEEIELYFSGIGDVDNWKTNSLFKDIVINLKIRCLDGRINSKEPFTKKDCYWEANEEDIKFV